MAARTVYSEQMSDAYRSQEEAMRVRLAQVEDELFTKLDSDAAVEARVQRLRELVGTNTAQPLASEAPRYERVAAQNLSTAELDDALARVGSQTALLANRALMFAKEQSALERERDALRRSKKDALMREIEGAKTEELAPTLMDRFGVALAALATSPLVTLAISFGALQKPQVLPLVIGIPARTVLIISLLVRLSRKDPRDRWTWRVIPYLIGEVLLVAAILVAMGFLD